jgi:hypothetical protein
MPVTRAIAIAIAIGARFAPPRFWAAEEQILWPENNNKNCALLIDHSQKYLVQIRSRDPRVC